MARYWSAVILDYCLHQTKPALAAYNDYLTHASLDDEYSQKAKKRIAALRGQP
jgi:hypothetical protein